MHLTEKEMPRASKLDTSSAETKIYRFLPDLKITYPASLNLAEGTESFSEEGFRSVGFTNFSSTADSRFPYIHYPAEGQVYALVGEFRDFPGSLEQWIAQTSRKMSDIERLFVIEDGSYATRTLISEEDTELDGREAVCHKVKFLGKKKELMASYTYFEYSGHIFQLTNLSEFAPASTCGNSIIQVQMGA